jgi:hypothetical protein
MSYISINLEFDLGGNSRHPNVGEYEEGYDIGWIHSTTWVTIPHILLTTR